MSSFNAHPMLTPHDDTVIAWQQACAQAADALRPQHDRERLAKALALAHEGAVTLGDDGAALVTSHGTRYRIDAGWPLPLPRCATPWPPVQTPHRAADPPAGDRVPGDQHPQRHAPSDGPDRAPSPARTAGPSRRPRPVAVCDCI